MDADVKKLVEDMEKKINNLQEQLEKKTSDIQNEIKQMDERLSAVSDKQTNFDTLETEVNDLHQSVFTLEGSMEKMDAWLENPEIDVGSFEE